METMNEGKRVIYATVILIVTVASFIIGYICLVWPVAYTTDTLIKAWPTDPTTIHIVGNVKEIKGGEISLNYFLAAAFVIGIILMFIWYWTYMHKRENE